MKQTTIGEIDLGPALEKIRACPGPSELVPLLSELNETYGYLPKEVLHEVAKGLKLPPSKVYDTATFYSMFSITPPGRHVVEFCKDAPCHIAGGREVWEAVKKELGLEPGQTSPDGKWTLKVTSCIGVCAVGPVMMVDGEIFGNLTPETARKILAGYD